MSSVDQSLAVIFDMDGVLIDSVRLNWQAMNQVLVPYGVNVSDEAVKRYLGRTLKDQVTMLNQDYRLQLDYREFSEATQVIKRGLFALLEPKEGVKELLRQLKSAGIATAVATSMPRDMTEQRLQTAGIIDHFDVLVTEEDVAKHKPEPDVFVKAAELLAMPSSGCVVFEDAPAGLLAAKAAKIQCIAVQTPYVNASDLVQTDLQVATLKQVAISQLRQLVAPKPLA
ncbi:MAG TPA: HAD family phosphatase [Verrucomicrobiae bacterium]|nr:HAD family phosphatase [Verrucomicrobiae bacterium]